MSSEFWHPPLKWYKCKVRCVFEKVSRIAAFSKASAIRQIENGYTGDFNNLDSTAKKQIKVVEIKMEGKWNE